MIEISCHIALVLLLVISFVQDWKYRAISWVVFPLILVVTSVLWWTSGLPVRTVFTNCFFVMFVIGCLFLYVSFKRKKLTNIFRADFGLGDVLFLLAITPLFIDRNYILFFITGMFLSGMAHLVVLFKKKKQSDRAGAAIKIPLAGYLAIYLIGLEGVRIFWISNLFYNPVL